MILLAAAGLLASALVPSVSLAGLVLPTLLTTLSSLLAALSALLAAASTLLAVAFVAATPAGVAGRLGALARSPISIPRALVSGRPSSLAAIAALAAVEAVQPAAVLALVSLGLVRSPGSSIRPLSVVLVSVVHN